MDKFDWLATIEINLKVLNSVGLWPRGQDLYKLDWYTLYAVLAGVSIVAGHNLSQIVNIYFVYTDLEALTDTIFLMTTNILATVKMYLFVRSLALVKKLFVTLNSPRFRPKCLRQVRLVQPALKQWKVSYVLFCCVVYFNVTVWSLGPILNGWVEDHRLPFEAWYPFDTKKSPNYELVYGYQVTCIWYITVTNLHLDTTIIALMMFVRTQCDILCDDLGHLRDSSFGTRLVESIKHHRDILSFAKDSNNVFNMIVLGQFATSTATLAMTMFQLTLVEPLSGEGIPFLLYLVGMTAEIFLYCWFGNEVEFRSNKISHAVYESDWTEQPQSVQKTLLIFCLRCSKPIKITAINLFTLSLQTFISILRSAYSYFAVLSNVNTVE
ncbi:hypothetical protein MTP99_008882 [Tenebrio molitor]|nr:hypothetical protein MTP99_008882 [Tenebrio molitor]